jgi:hypothetical protein
MFSTAVVEVEKENGENNNNEDSGENNDEVGGNNNEDVNNNNEEGHDSNKNGDLSDSGLVTHLSIGSLNVNLASSEKSSLKFKIPIKVYQNMIDLQSGLPLPNLVFERLKDKNERNKIMLLEDCLQSERNLLDDKRIAAKIQEVFTRCQQSQKSDIEKEDLEALIDYAHGSVKFRGMS